MTTTKHMLHALILVVFATVSAGCAGTGTEQSTGEYVDDTVLTTKVKAALAQDNQVDALDIQVETFKGVVQLSGFADSPEEQERAVQVATRVEGVKRVENDIRIKSSD